MSTEDQPKTPSFLSKKNKKTMPNPLEDPLQDCHFQRGIRWRKDMLCAIVKERLKKTPDKQILKRLRRGGVSLQKATELMNEATELFSDDDDDS